MGVGGAAGGARAGAGAGRAHVPRAPGAAAAVEQARALPPHQGACLSPAARVVVGVGGTQKPSP